MKKILLITLLFVAGMEARAQSDFDKSTDKENGAVVLKGQLTIADLKAEPGFDWMKSAGEYKPDTTALKYLKKHLSDYDMVVMIGTWCSDSQDMFPKLYRLIQLTGLSEDRYTIYGMDRAKEAKYVEHKLYKIEKVPTIILYKENNEVGRIVESVKKSLEKDLTEMIEADRAAE